MGWVARVSSNISNSTFPGSRPCSNKSALGPLSHQIEFGKIDASNPKEGVAAFRICGNGLSFIAGGRFFDQFSTMATPTKRGVFGKLAAGRKLGQLKISEVPFWTWLSEWPVRKRSIRVRKH
jgi:hypothetical protein